MEKHGYEIRKLAADLFEEGYGYVFAARVLALSKTIVRRWASMYKAAGREAFLSMGSKHRAYDYETKLAAVDDFIAGGLTRQEVMEKHGILSPTALDRWIRDYRSGGPDALRPKPKGRRAARTGPPDPMRRERELEAENRRLKAQVAYLKKLRALEAEKRAPGRNAR